MIRTAEFIRMIRTYPGSTSVQSRVVSSFDLFSQPTHMDSSSRFETTLGAWLHTLGPYQLTAVHVLVLSTVGNERRPAHYFSDSTATKQGNNNAIPTSVATPMSVKHTKSTTSCSEYHVEEALTDSNSCIIDW